MSCDHVVEGEVRTGSQEHFYMETHNVRVVPTGEDGEIAVYCGEQQVTDIQVNIASSNSSTSYCITSALTVHFLSFSFYC